MFVTTKLELASVSVSSLRTSSCPPLTVILSSSLTLSVSLTAVGVSLIPIIVIVISAVSETVPSLTV